MATFGGRPKGCNTCRRRKKGCDLNRPYCFRCSKEGRMCDGYERATVFVQHKPDSSTGSTRLRQFRSRPDYRAQPLRSNSVQADVVLHPGLARSAFGEQCASFWWDAYVPKADAFASQHILSAPTPQKLWCAAWADTITRMSTSSSVLRKALYALSLSCAGCQRRDEQLAREGLKYYCEALVQLGQILQKPESAVEDESLLPTCLQLADYEFFDGFYLPEHYRRPGDWQVHVEGINRLLQLRGAWKRRSADAPIVFQAYRKLQLALCFGRGRDCSPDNFEWSNLPGFDESKALKERLRDILMPVPGLLAKVYGTQVGSSEERQQVLQGLIVAYRRLRNWKDVLNIQLFDSGRCPAPELLVEFGMDVVDPCLLYWSACIAMYNAIERLRADASNPLSHDAVVLPDEDASVKNILTFASYLLRPEAGLAGVTTVCLPIAILVRYGIARDKGPREELEVLVESLVTVTGSGPLGPVIGNLLRQICYKSATLD